MLSLVAFTFILAGMVQRLRVEREEKAQALVTAEEAREQAEAEVRSTDAALEFLVALFERVDPAIHGSEDLRVTQLLDAGEAAIRDRLSEEPRLEARLRSTLGTLYANLGRSAEARSHYERALGLYGELDGDHLFQTASLKSHLGLTHLEEERYEEALAWLSEASEEVENVAGQDSPEALPILNGLVTFHCFVGDYATADEPSRKALALARRVEADPSDLAAAVNNRAVVERNLGDPQQAVALYEEGLELETKRLGEHHSYVAVLYNNLGTLLVQQNELAHGERAHRRALELRQHLFGDHHVDVVQSRKHLAEIRRLRGDLEGAEVEARQAYEIYRGLERGGPFRTLLLATGLAEIWVELERFGEAEDLVRRHLAEAGPPIPPSQRTKSLYHAMALRILGRSLLAQKRFDEAERRLQDGLALADEIEHQPSQEGLLQALVELYGAWGKSEKATFFTERLLQSQESIPRPDLAS